MNMSAKAQSFFQRIFSVFMVVFCLTFGYALSDAKEPLPQQGKTLHQTQETLQNSHPEDTGNKIEYNTQDNIPTCRIRKCRTLSETRIRQPIDIKLVDITYQRFGRISVGNIPWFFPLDDKSAITDAETVKHTWAKHIGSIKKILSKEPPKKHNKPITVCEPHCKCDMKNPPKQSKQPKRSPRTVQLVVPYTPRKKEVIKGVTQELWMTFNVQVLELQVVDIGYCKPKSNKPLDI